MGFSRSTVFEPKRTQVVEVSLEGTDRREVEMLYDFLCSRSQFPLQLRSDIT